VRWVRCPGEMKEVSMGVESSTIEISGSTLETVMLEGRLTPPGEFCLSDETEVIRSPEPECCGRPASPIRDKEALKIFIIG
jgi:hypothetical protein